ncbi:MAG: hypothetical protein AVDCRST_MAG68-4208 [uncultured Gemmatimonadetes bacterium]|uniref:BIG2 domain-containing protein n=1 Tax=uncultured Gemmatimonadota bacterium TaxID=203437 RepID=A0A6J4MKL0_9BACT|nr:MAG: hypothetical protein AVDCRST_MAG68-4208 [uncultured Gemmatimonadota bacterium]
MIPCALFLRPAPRRALLLPLLALLAACGGGDKKGGVITDPPKPDLTTASVEVTAPAAAMQAGQTMQLSVTAKNAAGTALSGKTFTWQSSSDGLASVSPSGMATAKGAGTVTFTATETASNRSGSMSVPITPAPVASVDIAPAAVSIAAGESRQLAATARDAAGAPLAGRAVAWSSSSTAVATVDAASGMVRAVAVGEATITASSEGRSATATVTVTPAPIATLALEPAAIALPVGGTRQLTVTARDAAGNTLAGRTVTITTSNRAVAAVSGSTVTAVAPGSATLTAVAEGKSTTATVTVTLEPIATITLEPTAIALPVGGTRQLTVTARDAAGNTLAGHTVTITSSNAAVATVSGSTVTAVATGNATLTAVAEGKSATATVTVTPPAIATLALEPALIALQVGGTRELAVTARDAAGNTLAGRTVTITSSNAAVATVSGSTVTAVGPGNAILTAVAEGKSASATVTVTLVPIATLALEPVSFALQVGGTRELTVTARDAAGNMLAGRTVTITSSNAAVAAVSGSTVTAIGPGNAFLTASAEGVTAVSGLTVTAVPVASVSVSPAALTMETGTARTFTATALDATGAVLAGRATTWSSSNTGVATVNAGGGVTAHAPGVAIIWAGVEARSGSAMVTVVNPTAARVTLSPVFVTQNPGTIATLNAYAYTATGGLIANPGVTWSSLDPAVAGVSNTGTVTTYNAGRARIVARVDDASDTTVVAVLGPNSLLSTAFSSGAAIRQVRAGETFTVPVLLDLSQVSPNGDLGAVQFELRYDPAVLLFQSAAAGLTGGGSDFHVPSPGTFRFSFAGTAAQGKAGLTLATLTFQVAAGTPAGTQRGMNLIYTVQPANTAFQRYEMPIAMGGRIQVID